MGNHTAGTAMGMTAQAMSANRPQSMTALEILDMICEPYRGCDAEFESSHPTERSQVHPDFEDWRDPHPGAGLGMLLLEAFAPGGVADLTRYAPMLEGGGPEADEACDAWWDEIRGPFAKRYDFC